MSQPTPGGVTRYEIDLTTSATADPDSYPGGNIPDTSYIVEENYWRPCSLRELRPLLQDRAPISAIGSNRDPAQLRQKILAYVQKLKEKALATNGGNSEEAAHLEEKADSLAKAPLPVTKARIKGVALGVMSHMAGYGAFAYGAYDDPDAEIDVHITWLDALQLEAITSTEDIVHLHKPPVQIYELVTIPGQVADQDGYRISLEDDTLLSSVGMYVPAIPLLTDEETGQPLPTQPQPEIRRWLSRSDYFQKIITFCAEGRDVDNQDPRQVLAAIQTDPPGQVRSMEARYALSREQIRTGSPAGRKWVQEVVETRGNAGPPLTRPLRTVPAAGHMMKRAFLLL